MAEQVDEKILTESLFDLFRTDEDLSHHQSVNRERSNGVQAQPTGRAYNTQESAPSRREPSIAAIGTEVADVLRDNGINVNDRAVKGILAAFLEGISKTIK